MATTNFINRQTPIMAEWLNDVDEKIYQGTIATGSTTRRTLEVRAADVLNVKDFGAVGDGITDDVVAVQATIAYAVAAGGGHVFFPRGTYNISIPLLTYQNITLLGEGSDVSIIKKTTTTVGSGTSRARGGAITDSYVVDSIISVWHDDTGTGTLYSYRTNLYALKLEGIGNTYGIYAPRVSQCMWENLYVENVATAILTYDAWMMNYRRITSQGTQRGIRHADDGSGFGSGTSCVFDSCWVNFDNTVQAPTYGFDLFGLTYSSLISCGVDNATRLDTTAPYAYRFLSCRGISMMACATEGGQAGLIEATNSRVTVQNFRSFSMTGNAGWGTVAGIFNDTSVLTFINCDIDAYTSPGTLFNQVIQNGATQTEIDSLMPSGGSTFISYSGGSKRTQISAGSIYVNDAQLVGATNTGWSAMTGTTNKASVYDTATVTTAQLAGRVMALQAALTTHGLLST